MTTPGRRGPYAKTVAVRRRILEAAIDAFAESGFRGTTMKDVARRAGISQRGLVHHFPSKEDLLLDVLTLREEESSELLAAERDLGMILGMLTVVRYNAGRPRLLELQTVLGAEATSPEHPAHDRFVARYDGLRATLTTLFGALRERGELTTDLDAATLATMYIALIDGVQEQWLYNRDAVDIDATLKAFLRSVWPGALDHLREIDEPPVRLGNG
jgi:AcrR family transcriptional regulator